MYLFSLLKVFNVLIFGTIPNRIYIKLPEITRKLTKVITLKIIPFKGVPKQRLLSLNVVSEDSTKRMKRRSIQRKNAQKNYIYAFVRLYVPRGNLDARQRERYKGAHILKARYLYRSL